jgi:hypothetical protein
MGCKLKITFVLPGPGSTPVGGFKVVYEYANHLSRRGHAVTVVHSARRCFREISLSDHAKNGIKYLQVAMGKNFRPDTWFSVDPEVNLLFVLNLAEKWIPDGDVIIATAWNTAECVVGYSASKGRGFYLIQGLETWNGEEARLFATWKSSLKKVVIANWLVDIAKELGEEAVYIPNGLNADEFEMDIPPMERDSKHVMMLYHKAAVKGSEGGIKALSMARVQEPQVTATLFGTSSRPASLPEWITYYQQPERSLLRKLYNQAAIFVAPSWSEGWGLTPSEAMLCGAALAGTDIGGHREFAFHEETALLSPVKSPQELAANIVRLMHDPLLRVRLAMQGHEYIQRFTWQRSTDLLEAVLCRRD